MHQVDYYQQLVRALGFANGPAGAAASRLPADSARGRAALAPQAGWDGRTPLVALAPGAAYGGAKRWPPESFAELADALAARRRRPVLIGSAGRRARPARAIEAALATQRRVLNLIGRTDLPTLAGVLAARRALVTNDSGAMHSAPRSASA